ncbi:uncharacterized protein LOC127278239 [Leptopilina boulardi]|uniref:uncharacterized protein LOC127278239 n=1 Tax=Leptopilina boulardi TaxID=63433 RepID=UPI0021F54116|nr:uncharacterized protein LOC127278239 [Leptopilina boulardi]
MSKKEYNGEHKKHEKLLRRKKEDEKQRFLEELEKAVKEGREWEVVNRELNKWKGINRNIKMEEWTEYFREMAGGVQNRLRGEGRRRSVEKGGEEIRKEELIQAIGKMKRNKAVGHDGMESESLMWGGDVVDEELLDVVRRVWGVEGWSEDWKTGVIVPLVKKGEGKTVEEYRGITLMPVGYKVYAEILRKKLEENVERLGGIPHSQAGFKKGMGTMDHIYTLNYLVSRNLARKKGKLLALFVDFKGAFPSVNRSILWEVMRKQGIEDDLIERIKEMYEDVRTRVRVGEYA